MKIDCAALKSWRERRLIFGELSELWLVLYYTETTYCVCADFSYN